jgi:hypothetical protein
MHLSHLLYISAATPGLGPVDVADILLAARRNNPSHQVTGMLLFIGSMFLQAIEGPEEEVTSLIRRIGLDARHSRLTVLSHEPAEARRFKRWSMGYERIAHPSVDLFELMRAGLDGRLQPPQHDALASLIGSFTETKARSG